MADQDGGMDENACQVAMESAMDKAIGDFCGPGEREKVTADHFGLDPDEIDTDAALSAGVGPDSSPREVREWVHARSNQLIEQGETFSEASAQAWSEADGKTEPVLDDDPAADDDDGLVDTEESQDAGDEGWEEVDEPDETDDGDGGDTEEIIETDDDLFDDDEDDGLDEILEE